MDEEKRDEEDEKRQLKKLKFLGLNPKRFKSKMYDLLKENPDLMSGIPKDMKYDSKTKSPKRNKWEETFKRWRRRDKDDKKSG